jgi:predicted transcriptional regulator
MLQLTKIAIPSPYLSIIILNVTGLNELGNKTQVCLCCLQETHSTCKDKKVESEKMEDIVCKKIPISEKINCQ